jgi:hypothetical protein
MSQWGRTVADVQRIGSATAVASSAFRAARSRGGPSADVS